MTATPELEVSVDNPNTDYTYTWSDETNAIVGSTPTVTLREGGVYSVIATSQYGCDSEEQTITITESSIASITSNMIQVVDDSDNNSIQIDNSNLGQGVYEYRLLDENLSEVYSYQDNPFFENLEGGLYTLQINDKNGCGTISYEVSLLSFPKFFTPNGDGTNDSWQVKGINNNFYQGGTVTFFNRFGIPVGKINANDSNGWNGIFNGKQLPPNDYWFVVELLDINGNPRIRKGNFSLIWK